RTPLPQRRRPGPRGRRMRTTHLRTRTGERLRLRPGGRSSPVKILFWHMHGGWADAFVRGEHEYLLPTTTARDPFGIGRAGRDWPSRAREISPNELAETDIDVVVLQRLEEFELATQWLGGRTPGRDLPTVFVEHNTPKGNVRSEEHTSELQSRFDVVCRLLLDKKKPKGRRQYADHG